MSRLWGGKIHQQPNSVKCDSDNPLYHLCHELSFYSLQYLPTHIQPIFMYKYLLHTFSLGQSWSLRTCSSSQTWIIYSSFFMQHSILVWLLLLSPCLVMSLFDNMFISSISILPETGLHFNYSRVEKQTSRSYHQNLQAEVGWNNVRNCDRSTKYTLMEP